MIIHTLRSGLPMQLSWQGSQPYNTIYNTKQGKGVTLYVLRYSKLSLNIKWTIKKALLQNQCIRKYAWCQYRHSTGVKLSIWTGSLKHSSYIQFLVLMRKDSKVASPSYIIYMANNHRGAYLSYYCYNLRSTVSYEWHKPYTFPTHMNSEYQIIVWYLIWVGLRVYTAYV